MAYTLTYHYNQQVLVLTNDHMNQKMMMLKDSVKKNKERKTNSTLPLYHRQACRPMNTVFF